MKITLDKNFVEKNKYILDDIFSKEQLWLNDVDFRSYMEITRQTILGRSRIRLTSEISAKCTVNPVGIHFYIIILKQETTVYGTADLR